MPLNFRYNHALVSALSLALGVCASAPALAWTSLAPTSEAAISVLTADGKDCQVETGGIDPSSITGVTNITSEIFSNHEGDDISSCLIYDQTTTASTYGQLSLGPQDVGTNDFASEAWYRPIARNADNVFEEGGALEVGSFTFNLDDQYSSLGGKLKFRFLDTEGSWAQTGVTIGGTFYRALDAKGTNNNIAELILDMADVFTISVGQDTGGTGDGVNFQVFAQYNEPKEEVSVPEPSMLLGFVGIAGLLKSRRRS